MPTASHTSERLIVPYGVARVTDQNLQHAPRVAIDRAAHKPLRLGDGPYNRRIVDEEAQSSSSDSDATVGAARLDILRRLHLRDCDPFDKHLRRWLDLYFEFVAAQAREHSAELLALARTPEATFDPLLWGMAALRPLPRAHLRNADSEFVAIDVALWDGEGLIAVVFAGTEKARLAQSLAGAVRLLTVDPSGASTGPDIIAEQLGDAVIAYWRGLAVPPDPFGPTPFRLGASAAPSF